MFGPVRRRRAVRGPADDEPGNPYPRFRIAGGVVEILSRSPGQRDRGLQEPLYERAGVPEPGSSCPRPASSSNPWWSTSGPSSWPQDPTRSRLAPPVGTDRTSRSSSVARRRTA